MSTQVWKSSGEPPKELSFKLELRPSAWKARMWRSSGDFVQPMMRLDASLRLMDIEDHSLRELFTPFQGGLNDIHVFLERGAGAPLPLSWSIGWLELDQTRRPACFLHRVLDDSWGNVLATLFRAGESRADVTLSIVPYDISRQRVMFAVRDYDIGTGADLAR
jgi:hypothetical protein